VPITATDLVHYAAVNMPDDDVSTAGGAIDTARYLDFAQISATDSVEALSDGADTRTLTIEGRKADGTIASETKALTGATFITFSVLGPVERVLKAELSAADASRTVTVRKASDDVTIRALPQNKRGFLMFTRKAASDPSSTKNFYSKGFWKNEHGTLALLNAQVLQNADPDARIMHLLAAAVNDTATVANRLTAPAAADTQDPDTFDDSTKSVPGTNLAAGAAIGVWYRTQLPAADPPHRSTYTTELRGDSI
jgi:hypothetical protein